MSERCLKEAETHDGEPVAQELWSLYDKIKRDMLATANAGRELKEFGSQCTEVLEYHGVHQGSN